MCFTLKLCDVKMTQFLLRFFLFALGLQCDALSNVRVSVPDATLRGDSARLLCDFDLDGDALYSVKWYKGKQEFYRYTPREVPPVKTFVMPGHTLLQVDTMTSNATQVTLREVLPSMSGKYSCEVSADAPSFQTALVTGRMDVVIPPKHRPALHGLQARYKVGDTLRVNCTSTNSLPAANLSWILNDHQVHKDVTKVFHMVKENANDLETSISILEKFLNPDDFSSNGRIKVRCSASILNVYWQTTEKSAEWDRPKRIEHHSNHNVLLNLQTDIETVPGMEDDVASQVPQLKAASTCSIVSLSSYFLHGSLLFFQFRFIFM